MNSRKNEDKAEERPALWANGHGGPSGSLLVFDQPHIIHATAVYTVEDLRRFFKLKSTSVRREVRLGHLRIAKRCGRYFCLGQWVLQWLDEGQLRSTSAPNEAAADRNERDG